MRREYVNPPVEELVLGVYFAEPILTLRAEHVGVFWGKVRSEFPFIEQQEPLRVIIQAPGETFPMPRFWLKTKEDAYLVQIQRNGFMLNWRKREGAYPHYATVKKAFDLHYKTFKEFVREELKIEPTVELCELTYVNNIVLNPERVEEDIAAVIPSFRALRPDVEGVLQSISLNNTIEVAKDLRLIVTVRTALRNTDKARIVVFEQRASGQILGGGAVVDAWFERAHDLTGASFNSLTSEHFQKNVWKIKGGS